MFLTGYLALILFAALPLIRTLSTGRAGEARVLFLHRIYRASAHLAAAVNPMQKKDPSLASSTRRKRANEGQRGKKDQSEISGQEHKPTLSEKPGTLMTRHV